MITTTIKGFIVVLTACFLLMSCGSDGVDCSNEAAINNVLEDGSDRVIDALTNFSSDPSDANCNTLKNVYSDWIDDLESFQDCANETGQGQEFRDAIAEARSSLNDIPC